MNVPRILRRLFKEPFDGLRNFRVVEANALYRCGQPTPAQLRELIAAHGLRTVIALRGRRASADPDSWEAEERGVCEQMGAEFVSLPCNHANPPTPEQVARFLELVRDAERLPALVHCRIGQQRTGMFCALYRVHVQGSAPQEALREMDDLGFGIRRRRHRLLLNAYYDYCANEPGAALATECEKGFSH